MRSPCFDEKNRQDCPRRHAGCAATCPEWAEYEKQRNAEYAKAEARNKAQYAYADVREQRSKLYRNHRLRYPKKNYLGGNENE